ncbi:integrase catalytic domain-containing protein [Trichonephila clavipes]|nr:integrase catalytic domain-containing protein [Trichonephila clavipes]
MDEEANFPIAASVLWNNLYMDDVLCAAATLEESIVLRQQLKGILISAGMELHKLCANHEKLSPDPEQNYNFAFLTETKTKRDVLSTIAKIFVPVGLMAPVIFKAKIFLQRLWRSKLECNDLLPAEEYREWQQFLVSLENSNNIEIPRRILVAFPEVIEIHGFADASEWCYGAAVYCKSKNLKSKTLVLLITSKSRLASIKSLTIPRLELCDAVLLAKLVKRVVAALQLETAELYLWSDSMIVLAWLRKEPMDLKSFEQNRVAKIQELYPNQLWRHVPSDQNPADSRGVDPDKLLQQHLWFNGPTLLSAVHIELVSDLTSQALIAALKRFMARRGKCAKLFSDNGKNFVEASNRIKKLLEIVRNPDEKLANYLASEGIEWKFIPARSPNFGGLWEAAIKSCKYHLKRFVNGINLTYEELLTFTVQMEGILNSRPLCPLSNNDDDFQVLTPAHFLINRSLNSLEEPNLTKLKESNLKKSGKK